MKALVCLLLVPAGLAVWILGSPRTAWRVIEAFRRRGPDGRSPGRPADAALRVGATLALFSIMLLIVLVARSSD